MALPPHDTLPGSQSIYFVTASAWQGRMLFQSSRVAELFIATLNHYRARSHYLLHAFVIMPNHFHALISPTQTLERAMQLIKGGFSHEAGRQLGRKLELWQRGYVDHRIRGAEDYRRHVEYIHQNPVRAHLCEIDAEYPYSSANQRFVLDPPPQGLKPQVNGKLLRHG